jgi:hypothetical protein
VIFSPSVPVFRDDDGNLLPQPYPVSFVTAAAPNAGALGPAHAHARTLPGVLSARAAKVLAVFWASGLRRLVLGAWGCGVFRNPPDTVAAAFAHHLGPSGAFFSKFELVTFAAMPVTRACRLTFHDLGVFGVIVTPNTPRSWNPASPCENLCLTNGGSNAKVTVSLRLQRHRRHSDVAAARPAAG